MDPIVILAAAFAAAPLAGGLIALALMVRARRRRRTPFLEDENHWGM